MVNETSVAAAEVHLAKAIPIGIILFTITLLTILGNAIVIFSVVLQPQLRSSCNLYVVSLAVSDLLIGAFVLPVSTAYEILARWIFGEAFCVLWASVNVLSCTASILNVCAISLDRWLAISRPLQYPRYSTRKRVVITVTVVWLISLFVSVPPIASWRSKHREREVFHCELVADVGYIIYSSAGGFYIPLVLMLFFYSRIYIVAKKQADRIREGIFVDVDGTESRSNVGRGEYEHAIRRSLRRRLSRQLRLGERGNKLSIVSSVSAESRATASTLSHRDSNVHKTIPGTSVRRSLFFERKGKVRMEAIARRLQKFSKEMKAAKTLSIIMVCLLVCWSGFFVTYVVRGLCECHIPDTLFKTFFYLGYVNSMINPIIYPFLNRDFRRAMFLLFARCCRRKALAMMAYFDKRQTDTRTRSVRRIRMSARAKDRVELAVSHRRCTSDRAQPIQAGSTKRKVNADVRRIPQINAEGYFDTDESRNRDEDARAIERGRSKRTRRDRRDELNDANARFLNVFRLADYHTSNRCSFTSSDTTQRSSDRSRLSSLRRTSRSVFDLFDFGSSTSRSNVKSTLSGSSRRHSSSLNDLSVDSSFSLSKRGTAKRGRRGTGTGTVTDGTDDADTLNSEESWTLRTLHRATTRFGSMQSDSTVCESAANWSGSRSASVRRVGTAWLRRAETCRYRSSVDCERERRLKQRRPSLLINDRLVDDLAEPERDRVAGAISPVQEEKSIITNSSTKGSRTPSECGRRSSSRSRSRASPSRTPSARRDQQTHAAPCSGTERKQRLPNAGDCCQQNETNSGESDADADADAELDSCGDLVSVSQAGSSTQQNVAGTSLTRKDSLSVHHAIMMLSSSRRQIQRRSRSAEDDASQCSSTKQSTMSDRDRPDTPQEAGRVVHKTYCSRCGSECDSVSANYGSSSVALDRVTNASDKSASQHTDEHSRSTSSLAASASGANSSSAIDEVGKNVESASAKRRSAKQDRMPVVQQPVIEEQRAAESSGLIEDGAQHPAPLFEQQLLASAYILQLVRQAPLHSDV